MAWESDVKTAIGWPAGIGLAILIAGFGGFGIWAFTAPLEGAVVAEGKIVAAGNNKPVQHLEGGIVKKMLVSDGAKVAAGEPLLLLDRTDAAVRHNRLLLQIDQLQALEARAMSELAGQATITFSDRLLSRGILEAATADAMEAQELAFRAGLQRFEAEVRIFERQKAALAKEIDGLQILLGSLGRQLELVAGERADAEMLLQKKLIRKSRVLELRRTIVELEGKRGTLATEIAKAEQSIGKIDEQLFRLRAGRSERASSTLADLRQQETDLLEQLRTAEAVLDRLIIRAPAAGSVVNLVLASAGTVIRPGQSLMDIVPTGVAPMIEVKMRPVDAAAVSIGKTARLVFPALKRQQSVPIYGTVKEVSADRLEDDRSGKPYYLVKIALDDAHVFGKDDRSIARPGQPVEVFVSTEQRTMAQYLAAPIMSALRRAMREG